MKPATGSVTAWLEAFASAVRDRNFAAGRVLFAPDAIGFGTRMDRAPGLDALVAEQWGAVWPMTEGFAFEPESVGIHLSPDARLACVQALWHSRALPGAGGDLRRGRATLLLERESPEAAWKAIHTHFSRMPSESQASERAWQPSSP